MLHKSGTALIWRDNWQQSTQLADGQDTMCTRQRSYCEWLISVYKLTNWQYAQGLA